MDFTIHACHVRQKGPPADTMVIFCQRHNETMQHLQTDNCFLHITSFVSSDQSGITRNSDKSQQHQQSTVSVAGAQKRKSENVLIR